jgi:hypothetical protein
MYFDNSVLRPGFVAAGKKHKPSAQSPTFSFKKPLSVHGSSYALSHSLQSLHSIPLRYIPLRSFASFIHAQHLPFAGLQTQKII